MCGSQDSQNQGEQNYAWTPLFSWSLQSVRYPDGGVNGGEESQGCPYFIVGRRGGGDDWWREAVKTEGDISTGVAVEAAGDPPEAGSERERGEDEGQAQEQVDVTDFVAHFPGGRGGGLSGEDALDGQRKASGAIGQCSVMDIAAGGEVPGERGGFLPHFPAASGVGVVGIRKGLMMNDPKALREQERQ